MEKKYKHRKSILIMGLIALIVSCGGGGGSSASINNGGSSTPTNNQNSRNNNGNNNGKNGGIIAPIQPDDNNWKQGSGVFPGGNNILKKEDIQSQKYKGKGVKVGIVDVDFLSNNKKTTEFGGYERNYNDIKMEEFGDRLRAYDNGNRYIENVDKNDDWKDNHGLIVGTIIGGKSLKGANEAELYAMSIKDGSGISIDLENYKRMQKAGVRIYNQSFGNASGNELEEYKNGKYKKALKAYMRTVKEKYILDKENERRVDEFLKFYTDSVKEGSLFVWAAGNTTNGRTWVETSVEAGLPKFIPNLHKGWIAVVGVREDRTEYNPHLAWAGKSMYWAIAANGSYCYKNKCYGYGSSFAAPRVTATAAKIKEKYPWMTGHEIQQTILTTADDIGEPDVDSKFGWGYLNEMKALNGPAKFDSILLVGESAAKAQLKGKFNANITDEGRYIFSNDISGDGGLLKTGKGTLVLAGNNTYFGETEVRNGTLEIKKSVISNIAVTKKIEDGIVKEKGTLVLGDKAVVGKSVKNDGVVKVESGSATITGNYIATNNSETVATLGSTLIVDGKTELDKASIVAFKNGDYFSERPQEYNVIKAKGGVEGNFGEIHGPELLRADSTVKDNKVSLNIQRKNVKEYVETLEKTDKMQKDTAENVEQLFREIDKSLESGDKINEDVMKEVAFFQNNTTSSNVGNSLDSLSGQIHGSAQALTFKQADIVNRDLSNRLSAISVKDENSKNGVGVWTNGIGANGRLHQEGYAEGKMKLYGGQVGIDKKIGNNIIVGISTATSKGTVKFNRFGGKLEADNYTISLYGRKEGENIPFYIQGRLGIGNTDSKVKREIALPNENTEIEVNYKNKIYSAYVETGYKFGKNNLSVSPYIGFAYNKVVRNEFKEKNSKFGLSSKRETYNQNSILVGARIENKINIFDKQVKLYGYGTYKKALNEEKLKFDASYNGVSNAKITVKGIELPKESIFFGVGSTVQLNENFEVYLNYENKMNIKQDKENVISTGFRVAF